jgi:hypothetical protein
LLSTILNSIGWVYSCKNNIGRGASQVWYRFCSCVRFQQNKFCSQPCFMTTLFSYHHFLVFWQNFLTSITIRIWYGFWTLKKWKRARLRALWIWYEQFRLLKWKRGWWGVIWIWNKLFWTLQMKMRLNW